MARRHLTLVLHYLRRLGGPAAAANSTDRQLLQQFIAAKDEAAFAALVQRHGPRVLGVCRRILANAEDADDAFQATFLVLAGKARSIGKREAVGSWLYGVAYRVALRARSQAARRRGHEQPLADCVDAAQEDPAASAGRRELCAVVGEELSRLPEKYRAPLLFCDGEGQSWALAARELSWPVGTLQRRLERGRELLRGRLERRGVLLPATALAAAIGGQTARLCRLLWPKRRCGWPCCWPPASLLPRLSRQPRPCLRKASCAVCRWAS
jgi:HlyD family secretion protein